MRQHLKPLTGLRFFAALGVVATHYAMPGLTHSPQWLRNIVLHGPVFVDMFFVLSGFILTYTYIQNGRLATSCRDFWAARFARIYPVYLLGFILTTPFVIHELFGHLPPHTALVRLMAEGGLTLPLLQAWVPSIATQWNGPGWSLSVEAFFYATFPLLAVYLCRTRTYQAIMGIAALWGISILLPTFSIPLPVLRLPEFLIGVLFGKLYGDLSDKPIKGYWLSLPAAALVIVVMGWYRPEVIETGLIAPLFGCLILGLAFGGGWLARFLSLPLIVLLGEASYALYILHVPIISLLMSTLKRSPLAGSIDTFPAFVGMALLAIGCSVLAYVLLERPMARWLRARLSRDPKWRYADPIKTQPHP